MTTTRRRKRTSKNYLSLKGEIKKVGKKVDGLETRFDGLETRFDGLETRFDGLGTRVNKVEKNLQGVRKEVRANRKAIEKNSREILAFKHEIDNKIDDYQQMMERKITEFKDTILAHLDPIAKELETARKERAIIGHHLPSANPRLPGPF